ncbi:hypothetical protein AP071_17400 [Rhodobacter capsulatus]|nr:hypothetical protein AP071_17400 [Rhodobacter capsulatus]
MPVASGARTDDALAADCAAAATSALFGPITFSAASLAAAHPGRGFDILEWQVMLVGIALLASRRKHRGAVSRE